MVEILGYSEINLAFLIGFVPCFHSFVEYIEVVLYCSHDWFIARTSWMFPGWLSTILSARYKTQMSIPKLKSSCGPASSTLIFQSPHRCSILQFKGHNLSYSPSYSHANLRTLKSFSILFQAFEEEEFLSLSVVHNRRDRRFFKVERLTSRRRWRERLGKEERIQRLTGSTRYRG